MSELPHQNKWIPAIGLLLVGIAALFSKHESTSTRVRSVRIQQGDELLLTNPTVLGVLTKHGLGFHAQLGGDHSDLAGLSGTPLYASLIRSMERDLRHQKRMITSPALPYKGPVAEFNADWLASPDASFELIGLINRIDRAMTKRTTCGEVRAIYRLRYDKQESQRTFASRLPMTVNLVYEIPPSSEGCRVHFSAAMFGNQETNQLDYLAGSKVWGPILTGSKRFDLLEVNVQLSRWPAVFSSNFAEQSHYLLRVLEPQGQALVPVELENTPNVMALKKDPQLMEQLKLWIRQHLKEIDDGSFLLPVQFLTKKAVSISPFGLNRRSNRLYSAMFANQDFADLDFSEMKYVKSPAALLRRLDTFTCVGCHQSRAVAGFHLLGEPDGPLGFNQLATPASTHVRGVLPWRRVVATKLQESGRDVLSSISIPPPERSPYLAVAPGSHCGLGDPGFASWGCGDKMQCYSTFPSSDMSAEVGSCYPSELGYDGAPCDHPKLVTNFHPALDTLVESEKYACAKGSVCASTLNGFPAGLCASRCKESKGNMVCLDAPELGPFSACLRERKPFADCLAENSFKAAVPSCDVRTPCRDEYVCLAVDANHGACLPPYILPQLNIDNHPTL